MQPEITVVVPVYNRARTVLDTLASVADQGYAPAGLIVVDDGSTDGTADSVEGWLRERVPAWNATVVRSANRGAGAARNLGLAQVATRWVAFLDSDDLWPADFLARAYDALHASPQAVAATADRRYVDLEGCTISLSSTAGVAAHATQWLFENNGGIASASVLRTAAVRELGGFPEDKPTGQDSALFQPLSLAGPWLHLRGEPVTYCDGLAASRGEVGNLSHSLNDNRRQWAEIYEDFILRRGGNRALPRKVYAPVLAHRWFCAGLQLRSQGRDREARDCFARSLPLAVSLANGPAVGRPVFRPQGSLKPPPRSGPMSTEINVAMYRLSVVIEWENILLAEQVRCRRMLAQLAAQCREVLADGADERVRIAGPIEVLILFDPHDAQESEIAEVGRECLGDPNDAIQWRTAAAPGLSYYTMKNAGVKLAGGDIVVQLDSDVIPDAGWLANLVAPFADPAVQVVGGNTYIGPTSLYAKTVALTWVFPLRAEHGRLEPTRHFHANNVAFRRTLALAYPYQEFPGRSRGACAALALQLIAAGIQPYLNSAAQVDHPAPNGLGRYLIRALMQGRDQMLGFHTDPSTARSGPGAVRLDQAELEIFGAVACGAVPRSPAGWLAVVRAAGRRGDHVGILYQPTPGPADDTDVPPDHAAEPAVVRAGGYVISVSASLSEWTVISPASSSLRTTSTICCCTCSTSLSFTDPR